MYALLQKINSVSPTAIDSLKSNISFLNSKIDSLEKITLKNEIGSNFFSDALATNLTLFAAIIGLATLLNVGYFKVMLFAFKRKITQSTNDAIEDHNKLFSTDFKFLKDRLNYAIFDVNRSMYFIKKAEKDDIACFLWNMWILDAAIDGGMKEEIDQLTDYIEQSLKYLLKIDVGEPRLLTVKDHLHVIVDKMAKVANKKSKDKVATFRVELNHILYSKPLFKEE